MRRTPVPALVSLVVVLGVSVLPATASPAGADVPVRSMQVGGTEISTYPAFDPNVKRYAARTGAATGGRLTLTASTSDPAGSVRIDGRLVSSGASTLVDGLEPGDEVSVQITDALGQDAYGVVYLPAGFPQVDVDVDEPGQAPGSVFMTLGPDILHTGPRFEVALDRNGVPVHVVESLNPHDFKRHANGHYTVARGDSGALDSAFTIVELDEAFVEVAKHRTTKLLNTDFHETLLRPDGHRILMAYERTGPERVDSIVQEVDAAGQVVFEWNSADHLVRADEGLTPLHDWAHLNSVDVMADGDWLLSFRHTSSVVKIARTAHDGFEAGEVVWRLGGTRSNFDFVGDDYAGPCAQHTARELPNGHILLFDNGSRIDGQFQTAMCASDPDDPTAPREERAQTRVVEYALDTTAMTATQVWEWRPTGQFSKFAGSSQRLENGNTAVGLFGVEGDPMDAVEVSPSGDPVWRFDAINYTSYRVQVAPAPDRIRPEIVVTTPAVGAAYQVGASVPVDYRCSDRGGSVLRSCSGTVPHGAALDTSVPGTHTFQVTGIDGAGNVTTLTRSYTVVAPIAAGTPAPFLPDAAVRKPGGRWVGEGRQVAARRQSVKIAVAKDDKPVRVRVRLRNAAAVADRMRADTTSRPRGLEVRWHADGEDITRRLERGKFHTDRLDPGSRIVLVAVIRRTGRLPAPVRLRLEVRSVGDPQQRDAVSVRVRPRQ